MTTITANQLFRLSQIARGELERDEDGQTYFWRDHDWNDRIVDPDIAALESAGFIELSTGPSISSRRVRWDVTDAYLTSADTSKESS